ncbi:nuclear pore complex subunit nup85 [Pyrenophora seminiperda CCB06]|uniref:Nuclear pore complex protein Nup85 n=1 Tax=Pyrenophora seminiperda CCB06 TaxID=1302712 RepID=A0A3M7LZ89_9PLEO|nr:nuclear pore complex subunit nup85 [Pyrenophora seminiperda CCB06]
MGPMFRGGPPSTPGRNSYDSQKFWESQNAPSTTPAGPPPDKSTYPSSTPGGAPPTMNKGLFSTSRPTFDKPNSYGFGATSLFGSSPPKPSLFEGIGSGSIGTSTAGRPPVQRGRPTSGTFRVPSASSDDGMNRDAEGDESEEDLYTHRRNHDDDEDEDESEDSEEDPPSASRRNKTQNRLAQSVVSMTSANDIDSTPALVRPGVKQTRFDLLALAKGLASNNGKAALQESDHVILETERLVEKAMESLHSDTPAQRTDVLGSVAQELITTWQAASKSNLRAGTTSSQSASATDILHASRLASLLLTLHHPPKVGLVQQASALALVPARSKSEAYTPIPRILLNWLNSTYSGASEVDDVMKLSNGYSRHPSFWEAVHITVVRGNFSQTLKLLQGAQLEHAETAELDGLGTTGYAGKHLQYANHAIRQALDLLRECPAILAPEDWDIKGHDWDNFRRRVQQTRADLEEFSEGESASRHAMSQSFQAAHFGISQTQASFQLSVASRKAESKVPWSIYENLGKLYQLLLGNEQEILELSADWIEAVIGLGVWWNGEEGDQTQGSLAASRRSIMRSQRVRPVDVTPIKAYCQRLSASLAAVIHNSDEDFGVNVVDQFEVGVACILDDNMEGALQIIQGWSLTIATAVAELASVGEWFSSAKGIMDQFDQSDLMVLSYTEQQEPKGVTKDDLLVAYSTLLASKAQLRSQAGQVSREGWEIAVKILGRLDDSIAANERIERILSNLPLESSARVDKITQLCLDLGLSQHAVTIAQKYADHLRVNTESYGETLLYYARAHDAQKIQEVLRVLVAHCMVKSIAYPPLNELDDSLHSLITSPKQTLTNLANMDSEAASLLSNHLSGYATIRKYFDLRDEEVLLKAGEKSAHRPMARKRAAANALMVIIASAASSIRGGLYDPEIETVVQVDVLLPLLGEALIFVNQPKRTLTLRHLYDLLAAVEDFDTAPGMIRAQCEEVLSTTLLSAHDPNLSQQLPNPHHLLSKSTSNLTTASSQYSLIGSTDFGSQDGQSMEGSTVLVKDGHIDDSKRGWDWRKGFHKGTKSGEIIAVLRLGVAREIGRAFAEGEVAA